MILKSRLMALIAVLPLMGCMSSLPPVEPHLAATADKVVSRASGSIGEEISEGMVLTKAYATGNTIFFETRADSVDALELRPDPTGRLSVQQRFERDMGDRFCRPGGVRRFVDQGGAVQIVVNDMSGGPLVGARLTGC